MDANLKRRVGLGGLLFVALLVVALVIGFSGPNGTASAAKVVNYYDKHKNASAIYAYLLEAAVIVGLAYFWYLRNWLIERGADARLTTLGFAGALVFGVGGAVSGGTRWALSDAVGHVTPAVLQAFSIMQDDLNTVLGAVGPSVFLFATGAAILRSGAMARWAGWLAIVMGVLSLPAFLGPLPVGIWILVTAIVMATSKAVTVRQPALATT